ncbi:hypothetical protein DFP72DRAFT_1132264 [Ephemerocybe angulata]|uniref:Uncharacterized protein n=1 Tax=Ephemerocybe angulata TaxID=980116 RepID=A0A8H6HUZ6_9AGAR|nr:hypothetical protein DFP72DRAFT_1132264 [Tulosesus angulatus]
MPKTTSKATAKSAARSASSLSRTARRKANALNLIRRALEDRDGVEEVGGPKSRVRSGKQITQTNATQLYRLNVEDLRDIPYDEERIDIPSKPYTGSKYLYEERDIERVAWKRHGGGPDEFQAYLDDLREKYTRNHPGKKARATTTTAATAGDKQLPSVTELAKQFKTKGQGDKWLWNVVQNQVLVDHPDDVPGEARLAMALEKLPEYPRRIAPPPGSSPSFEALKRVLKAAPTKLEKGVTNGQNIDREAGNPGSELFWSEEYFTRVYQALIDITKSHGIGRNGWEAARWLVYDKYSQWSGIQVGDETAEDGAYAWLQGRLPDNEKLKLGFYKGEPPSIWIEYNSRLPFVL